MITNGFLYHVEVREALLFAINIHQRSHQHKLESPRKSEDLQGLSRFGGGATRNRTRDTRIFSPVLYQLSYGTDAVKAMQIYIFFWKLPIMNLCAPDFILLCRK